MNSENTQNFDSFIEGVEKIDNTIELKEECSNLLQTSMYNDDEKSEFEKELWYYSEEELNRFKAMLYLNQTNNIDNGLNYTQGDILRKLIHDI